MLNKLGMMILEGIQVIGISAILIVILHVLIIQPQEVKGMSMYPYLNDGDHLMTEKITYRLRDPQRGEIVVFEYPLNRSEDYIKRVIGLPGEKIQVKNNKVIIYNNNNPEGFVLEEDYLDSKAITQGREFIKDGQILQIPDGKYVVFGDNRDRSSDSRQWGFIEKSDIVGRALFRFWPPQSVGSLILAN
ncbi:signal peptidase I [candidate division WWE3 bacterium CG10_big_fil_rev_8_21_14_0_10_32_10]|uniref:Signal peptidase I n=1 Tax=candidate division WWE3 bacterium CG10_big_fil_rev_8_21_14_0_10_32_10 TaxID=1975090 RepID=A0A2H0R8W0_UNCKA|nr:MAG: signal peptidase I [candidate division WWE3 bacterium CG10_big_fil_rev_8_21_14_0_10_32_10]